MIIDSNEKKAIKEIVRYNNKTALGWGKLSLKEQRMLDILVYSAQKQGNFKKKYVISMINLMHYYKTRGGSAYRSIDDSIASLTQAKFNVLNKENSKAHEDEHGVVYDFQFRAIPIFSELIKDKSNYYYSFSKDFKKFIFNLSNGNSYGVNLNLTKRIKSKNALIILKLWSAKKKNNSVVTLKATVFSWKKILGLSNRSSGRVLQEIKRAISVLNNIFGNRYFFSSFAFTPQKDIRACQIFIFGDNTTSYPITNKDDDFSNGEEIEFLHDRNFERNKNVLLNMFGIKYLNEKVRTVKEIDPNQIDFLS